jgi:putative tryptophan/tyrosine transport system substrate-binding protein
MERRGRRLNRREFVVGAAGLGLLARCGRLPGQAPAPAAPVRQIGWLSLRSTSESLADAFQHGLREHGYMEGQNVVVHYRTSDGRTDPLPALASELVGLPVDVIVAGAGPAVEAAKTATATIPIVMLASGDPVGTGLVDSLAHPGGNVTGLTFMSPQLSGKRLQLLREALPSASRVTALWNPAELSNVLEFRETELAAHTLGVELQSLEVREPTELDSAFGTLGSKGSTALIVFAHALTIAYRKQIADLAAVSGLPAMCGLREFVEVGALMAYGPDLRQLYRRAAYYVDRILKGTKPADLPVEQPMTFEFVVNMKTAQALGITFPNEIMLQVTEIIQ